MTTKILPLGYDDIPDTFGEWLTNLAPWAYFVTLTFRDLKSTRKTLQGQRPRSVASPKGWNKGQFDPQGIQLKGSKIPRPSARLSDQTGNDFTKPGARYANRAWADYLDASLGVPQRIRNRRDSMHLQQNDLAKLASQHLYNRKRYNTIVQVFDINQLELGDMGVRPHGNAKNKMRAVCEVLGFDEDIRKDNRQWVRVLEDQKERGVPHVHALITSSPEGAPGPLEMKEWAFRKYGIARILEYDPTLGAAGYLGKYLLKEKNTLDIEFGGFPND
jgi:hypothetical protein